MDDQRVPHILAVPFFFRGHEIPLLHLCRRLKSRGANFVITILRVSSSKPGDEITAALPKDLVGFVSFEEFPADVRLPAERNMQQFVAFFKRFQTELADIVVSKWQHRHVTCVISDVLVEWGQSVARHLGVPWLAFWTSTVLEMAVAYNIPKLVAEDSIKDSQSIVKIPGLPELKVSDYNTLSNFVNPHFPMRFMIQSLVDTVQRTAGAYRVLANSSTVLEVDAIKTLKASGITVMPVGPLHLHDQSADEDKFKDPNKVMEWLDRQEQSSVLYICFGTVAPMPAGQMDELEKALDTTKVPFLWVVRREHLPLVPRTFSAKTVMQNGLVNGNTTVNGKHGTNGTIASNGRSEEGNGNITAGYRGLLTDWVPQTRVLGHRAVGGFLTHCGWNSVLESITAGVPMIARPIMGDQTLTSAMLRQASMPAIALSHGTSAATEIAAAIEAVMVGKSGMEMRRKAKEIAVVSRKVMDRGGCSASNLDSLAKELNDLARSFKRK